MESQHNFDEVLTRYLLDMPGKDEEALIEKWINEKQEHVTYLRQLADTLKLVTIQNEMKGVDIDKEWAHQQKLNTAIPVENENAKAYDVPFVNEETKSSKTRVYKLWTIGAVAASLIFILLLRTEIFNSDKGNVQAEIKQKEINISSMVVLLHEKNITAQIKSFKLPDGSLIHLFSNSELTYRQPVDRSRREVLLNGKANFEVAKDKTRPFTVFSGDISTTALGTQFTVTAMAAEKLISVRLHEGKVAVKAVRPDSNNTMKDAYLLPGQELLYDVIKKTAIVKGFKEYADPFAKKDKGFKNNDEAVNKDNPLVPKYGKGSWYMFNNQPLKKIFDQLSGMFDVQIGYSEKDISNLYFIGTFNKSDSLEYILHEISSINNLSVIKNSKLNKKITYTIVKQQN